MAVNIYRYSLTGWTCEEQKIEVTPDAAWKEIPFICTVDNHRDLGMRGVFVVAPAR
jgi:uncharacterized cupredoxin-like copper-binding protein